eukprot:351469-Chlamydomonas_euryale.AAC.7
MHRMLRQPSACAAAARMPSRTRRLSKHRCSTVRVMWHVEICGGMGLHNCAQLVLNKLALHVSSQQLQCRPRTCVDL